MTRVVTDYGSFNLDDIRPHVSQDLPTPGTRKHSREVENPQACQRTSHGAPHLLFAAVFCRSAIITSIAIARHAIEHRAVVATSAPDARTAFVGARGFWLVISIRLRDYEILPVIKSGSLRPRTHVIVSTIRCAPRAWTLSANEPALISPNRH